MYIDTCSTLFLSTEITSASVKGATAGRCSSGSMGTAWVPAGVSRKGPAGLPGGNDTVSVMSLSRACPPSSVEMGSTV
jgi:hypothetical protein